MDNLFPVVSINNMHTPMTASDKLATSLLAVSTRTGNTLQILQDGLYSGTNLGTPTVYVAAAGTDAPSSGTKTQPYKTLQYCLRQLTERSVNQRFTSTINVALKSGENFVLTEDFVNYGDITLTFYGSQYGDFDSPPTATGAEIAMILDLQRPIIDVNSINDQGTWKSAGIRCMRNGVVQLLGVRVNLATRPASMPTIEQYGGYSDFCTFTNRSIDAALHLRGAVVNQGSTSFFGMLGIHARNGGGLFTEYSSQILVGGLRNGVDPNPDLNAPLFRQYCIKHYADSANNNQSYIPMAPTSTNSSSGSGLITMMWSESQSLSAGGNLGTLASFPPLFDQATGMRNYFYNLIKDQQQRPLNVISPRLF